MFATSIDKITVNDELDHLGLYLNHNLYFKKVEEMSNDHISFMWYREEWKVVFPDYLKSDMMFKYSDYSLKESSKFTRRKIYEG